MRPRPLFILVTLAQLGASQQIWDIWQTTWNRQELFTSLAPSTPINFVTPGPAASADIVVTETTTFQTINGFGGSLTDSSALTLNNLKTKNSANYWSILGHMFSVADGADASGFSYLRVPIGASDFSAKLYSLDDVSGDTSFKSFNINNAPAYLFSVIKDILTINPALKVHILPWSPPGWMKSTGTMNGGTIQSSFVSAYPTYLLKAVQGFQGQGITIYAISVQNEPQNSNPTYPTCTMTPAIEGQIGAALRTLLNNNGLSSVKLVGYEHNWDDAGAYPVTLMQDDGGSYDGVAFHCYAGSVANQDLFHNAFPSKNIYFTECSGTIGSDFWTDIKWYMDNLWIGSLEHNAEIGLMYNLALDGNGLPVLPGTNSCASGCRPIVTVNSDGSFSYNQEFYALAQASKAIIPKDAGGPWGKRIGVAVGGTLGWALRVGAYSTKRLSSTDFNRYSLVVMNWDDNASTTFNPVPVTATIEFRGMQAKYTFPVGVTTLWWFAAPNAQGLVTGFNATTVPVNSTSARPSASSQKSGDFSAQRSTSTAMPSAATVQLSHTSAPGTSVSATANSSNISILQTSATAGSGSHHATLSASTLLVSPSGSPSVLTGTPSNATLHASAITASASRHPIASVSTISVSTNVTLSAVMSGSRSSNGVPNASQHATANAPLISASPNATLPAVNGTSGSRNSSTTLSAISP
ncbi:glycoside hydrolase superfamily [Mycena alexandri]|uniref:Glycoside hydrolase superfamily n=1 Tax=Mycena alexandri TaxID=1745969 RepID=A0AAD6SZX8_9AGAR|nr:glycoside hydrolase superfamily [Mycena alexandri]